MKKSLIHKFNLTQLAKCSNYLLVNGHHYVWLATELVGVLVSHHCLLTSTFLSANGYYASVVHCTSVSRHNALKSNKVAVQTRWARVTMHQAHNIWRV